MKTFIQLCQILSTNKDLKKKIEEMEKKYDQQFRVVFEAIRQLLATESKPRKRISFEVRESKIAYGKNAKEC